MKKLSICLGLLSGSIFALQGFGVNGGGNDAPVYTVTSLADSGVGSLRDGLSSGNRHIIFNVDGEIRLLSPISIKGLSQITIDGAFNKSSHKNLVITNYGLYLSDSHNVIIQNIRIRGAQKYGILISNNSSNVVVDHCSVENSSQADVEFGKNIDITTGSHDITVSYSIVAYHDNTSDVLNTKYKGLLITDNNIAPVTNVALHHNLFSENYQRSPEISSPGYFVLVNNLISQWIPYGSRFRNGAYGNIISNYYQSRHKSDLALLIESDAKQFYLENNLGINTDKIATGKISSTVIGNTPKITVDNVNNLKNYLIPLVGAQPQDIIDHEISQNSLD